MDYIHRRLVLLVSVTKHSFCASPCPAVQQQKLLSSLWCCALMLSPTIKTSLSKISVEAVHGHSVSDLRFVYLQLCNLLDTSTALFSCLQSSRLPVVRRAPALTQHLWHEKWRALLGSRSRPSIILLLIIIIIIILVWLLLLVLLLLLLLLSISQVRDQDPQVRDRGPDRHQGRRPPCMCTLSLSMCIYIYTYVCIMYVIYIYAYMHTHMSVIWYVYIYIYIYIYTHVIIDVT